MRYLPINLDVRNKPVVVIGGGTVAARKCAALLAAGARITVIAPAIAPPLETLVAEGTIAHHATSYTSAALTGAFLVIAATDSPEVNRAVADEAATHGILAEITDSPELGSFTSPAFVSRGELLISVATGGRAPALSAAIRAELAERYGPEYARITSLLGAVREKLLTASGNHTYNKKILNELAERLPVLLRKNATADIDQLLRQLCGPDCSLAALEPGPKDVP